PMLGRPVEPFGPEFSAPEDGTEPDPLPDIAQTEQERNIAGSCTAQATASPIGRSRGMIVQSWRDRSKCASSFAMAREIGNEGQPGRLGDRLQLVNEGGDVVRGLAPRHIGSINRASPAGRISGSWALHFAFFDAGSPNALSPDDNSFRLC